VNSWNAVPRTTVVTASRLMGARAVTAVAPVVVRGDDWNEAYVLDVDLSLPDLDFAKTSVLVECEVAWYLTSDRRLAPVTRAVAPPFPVGQFVVVKCHDGLFKYSFPWGGDFQLTPTSGGVEVTATLLDVQRCGLSLWGRHKLTAPPSRDQLRIFRTRLSALSDCLWLEPYPSGARGAICLTDHPDFDTVEKLRLLVDLFVKHNFRFTKAVFPQSEPVGSKCEPGLDVPAYAALVTSIHEHGSEVAYHGFGPRSGRRAGSLAADECVRRAEMMSRFRPSSWTDHGTGGYLLSRLGRLEDGRELTDFLSQYGVRNYWSYTDLWDNPFRNLSCWHPRGDWDAIGDFWLGARLLRPKEASQLAFLLLQGVKNVYGVKQVGAVLRAPLDLRGWTEAVRERARLHDLRSRPFAIYGFDGRAFPVGQAAAWIFDTVLLNHPTVQLRPALVRRLCEESGLLLGHCYLSCEHPYIVGNCVANGGRGLRISPSFVANLEYIAERQRQGDVVSLSFAQLRASLASFSQAVLSRHATGWSARTNGGDGAVVVAGDRSLVSVAAIRGAAGTTFRDHVGFVHSRPGRAMTITTASSG
jgi:hypothetical protein